ncbi:hypothetical protein RUND412_006400 [Rhizina undulata]
MKRYDGITTSKASGTSAGKNEKSTPPSLSASQTNQTTTTMATSSQLVPSRRIPAKIYLGPQNRMSVEDYIVEWEFVRIADALEKKWLRMSIKISGQAATSDANWQEED